MQWAVNDDDSMSRAASCPQHYSGSLAAVWVLVCAVTVAAGWLLSMAGVLHCGGYLWFFGSATVLALGVAIGRRWLKRLAWRGPRWRWRFQRFLPVSFVILFALAFLGGLLHPPNNFDGLTYRIPRVLHWLSEGGWHWINSLHQAVNTRTTGIEWLSAPLIALTGTDRWLFLINTISFALMPGLVFGILRILGLGGRVAWVWMWIFPTGYCYLIQAGSIGNDMFGAVLFLAALFHALKARQSRKFFDVAISCLAMALCTGAKASNLTLALPWLIAIGPGLYPLIRRPVAAMAVLGICLVVSFVPNAYFNFAKSGDWTGLKLESSVPMDRREPLLRALWNTQYLVLQNIAPPIFPVAGMYNRAVGELIPETLQERLKTLFEGAAAGLHLPEVQYEEGAPLGLGVVALLLVPLLLPRRGRVRRVAALPSKVLLRSALALAALVSLWPLLANTGMSGNARYLAPTYLLLVLPLLASKAMVTALSNRLWRILTVVNFVVCGVLLILSPARPLWPAQKVLNSLGGLESESQAVRRAIGVYQTYSGRNDAFKPVRELLPEDADHVGAILYFAPETSLWRPFGSRRIAQIRPEETGEELRARGIGHVVVSLQAMKFGAFPPLEEYAELIDAEELAKAKATLRNATGPQEFVILRLKLIPEETAP